MTAKHVAASRQRLIQRGGRRLNLYLSPEAAIALRALSEGRSATQTIESALRESAQRLEHQQAADADQIE